MKIQQFQEGNPLVTVESWNELMNLIFYLQELQHIFKEKLGISIKIQSPD